MTAIRLATFLGNQGIPMYEAEMREWQKEATDRVPPVPSPVSSSPLSFADVALKFYQAVGGVSDVPLTKGRT